MMSAARISAPANATSEPRPETIAGRTPSAIVGRRRLSGFPGGVQRRLIEAKLVDRVVIAASTDAPISSVWSTTPRTVATKTTVISAMSPSTSSPAARLGLNPWRWRLPATGLKITARTAANRSGSRISLTAANAVTTMTVAHHEPTKLHAQMPIFGAARPSHTSPVARAMDTPIDTLRDGSAGHHAKGVKL